MRMIFRKRKETVRELTNGNRECLFIDTDKDKDIFGINISQFL